MGMDEYKKLVYVQDVKVGNASPFNVAQVKRYIDAGDDSHSFMLDIARGLNYFSIVEEEHSYVFLTEVFNPSDVLAISPEMTQAKRDEIRGLLERGTFKVILRE